ncbi:MAG: hypothetical protein J4G16_06870 [Acidobacteria bacterium]|nr:hypothetical protein [Acidobacteriota bacterium]
MDWIDGLIETLLLPISGTLLFSLAASVTRPIRHHHRGGIIPHGDILRIGSTPSSSSQPELGKDIDEGRPTHRAPVLRHANRTI